MSGLVPSGFRSWRRLPEPQEDTEWEPHETTGDRAVVLSGTIAGMDRTEIARQAALEEGFDLVGTAPLRPPRAADRFESWLAQGFQAGMGWLERQRERILDPRRILPEGKSLLVLGWGHRRSPVELEGGGRVARYAAGRDYHNAVGRKLRKLVRRLRGLGLVEHARTIVDAGPLLERSHAAEAGLGFESKAANLLHPVYGPWFFLSEVLVDADLGPSDAASPPVGSCGTCTACLVACPTGAIREPGLVDAGLCISYQTIENRGSIPHELRSSLGGWAFGCDVCSEVCPWGETGEEGAERLGTHARVAEGTLVDWLRTPEESFAGEFQGSPLQRPRRAGLARNAALALAHAPSDRGLAALRSALEDDPSPMVREAAGWALASAHSEDRGVRESIGRARMRAPDGEERSGLSRTLEESL